MGRLGASEVIVRLCYLTALVNGSFLCSEKPSVTDGWNWSEAAKFSVSYAPFYCLDLVLFWKNGCTGSAVDSPVPSPVAAC